MKKFDTVEFDYSLRLKNIKTDKETFDIKNSDEWPLRRIANGCIYMIFTTEEIPDETIIKLNTGLIDYLPQLKAVVHHLENFADDAFSVSGDFFSNSLHYTLQRDTNTLIIEEVNDGLYSISIDFSEFKQNLLAFVKMVAKELQELYPALSHNSYFQSSFSVSS